MLQLDARRFLGGLPVDRILTVADRFTHELALPEASTTVDDDEIRGVAFEPRFEKVEFGFAVHELTVHHRRNTIRADIAPLIILILI